MKPQASCKNCTKRKVGCHDRCEEYQKFKKEMREWQEYLDKIRSDKAYFDDKASKNVGKYKHKR
jgi:hypothetical protein